MVRQPDDRAAHDGSHDELGAAILDALSEVRDPEIPPVAITDLGIVADVRTPPGAVEIDLLPTFAGCPALDVIREDVEAAVGPLAGGRAVRVRFVTVPAWTSDRITPAGREAMRAYGLTPPGPGGGAVVIPLASVGPERTAGADPVRCPFCGSDDTVRESAFGPTLCRSTHYCAACRNPFEAFKPKAGPAVAGEAASERSIP
jgi:ring-1,2-phenylacetyl-CoA epoxidase subunit PaaD